MIRVRAKTENGMIAPDGKIPKGTARIIFDGESYCCYNQEEAAAIATREAEEAESARLLQEQDEAEAKQKEFDTAVESSVKTILEKMGISTDA